MGDNLRLLADFFREEQEIIIIGHKNADGDCLGTMGAFYELLSSFGSSVTLLTADPVPENYRFLPGMEDVRVCENFDCGGNPLLLLECGTIERSGISLKNYGKTVNFDHHPDNCFYAMVNIVDADASSIGEMATAFFSLYFSGNVTPKVADSLYVAIHTDTGGFSYGNTSEKALSAAAFLVRNGANAGDVCASIYQENRIEKVRLTAHFMAGIRLEETGKIGVGILRLDDLKKFGCSPVDTDNFSAFPRGIQGVEVGIFIMELSRDRFKVSLRAKRNWSVNITAKKMGGGGHRAAAGFVWKGPLGSLLKEVIRNLREENEE